MTRPPTHPHLDDLAAIAAVALLFLASCTAGCLHAALFVPPKPKTPPGPTPADIATADALIVASPIDAETGRTIPIPATPPVPLAAFQVAAIRRELMDVRESRWYFVNANDFRADLEAMRLRWTGLWDAPPLDDAARFPPREQLSAALAANRLVRQHFEDSLPLHVPYAEAKTIRVTIAECEQLYKIWDEARDAQTDYYFVTVRRYALKRLREMIGPEMYYAGALPPYAPVWRFRQID